MKPGDYLRFLEFLKSRISDDKSAAQAAVGGSASWGAYFTSEDEHGDHYRDIRDDNGENIVLANETHPNGEQAAHIARWDPARVLAECEVKRAILDAVEAVPTSTMLHVLRQIGSVYSNHPEYDPAWEPDQSIAELTRTEMGRLEHLTTMLEQLPNSSAGENLVALGMHEPHGMDSNGPSVMMTPLADQFTQWMLRPGQQDDHGNV